MLKRLCLYSLAAIVWIGFAVTTHHYSADSTQSLLVVQTRVKPATHVISTTSFTEETNCSATAVAKRALLTASHCEAPSDDLVIDGVPGFKIDAVLRDGNDHSILLIANADFKAIATFAGREYRPSEQVFIWGNPSLQGFVYIHQLHKGPYVATHVYKSRLVDVLGFESQKGDSGSAVFSASGEILGVVSLIGSIPVPPVGLPVVGTGAVRLGFTKAQIDRAKSF